MLADFRMAVKNAILPAVEPPRSRKTIRVSSLAIWQFRPTAPYRDEKEYARTPAAGPTDVSDSRKLSPAIQTASPKPRAIFRRKLPRAVHPLA